jgi:predicted RNase H-like HicB family nuclease
MTEYLIIIEKAENNYAAYCPDLPGVLATGSTRKETLELMKEAIEFHLEGLKAECLSIPEPTTTAASVEVTV